jgi:hypothetical protein
MDPDPAIFVSDLQDVNKFFACNLLKVLLHHFSKIKIPKKKSQNSRNQCFSLLFLLDDRRIRIRISDLWIRIWIREAQKHMDPTSVADPDPPDPHVFGPPGSGSTSQRYGSGSGPFYHHAKIVRKTLIQKEFCDSF